MTVMAIAAVLAAACSKPESAPRETTSQSTPAAAGSAAPPRTAGPVDITFKTTPETPTTGDNTFEVMVMQGGQPVNDAQVSVEFQMPAMPQMKMPEMKNKADLMPA